MLACNRKEIVDAILERTKDIDDFDKPVQVQIMKKNLTPTGWYNFIIRSHLTIILRLFQEYDIFLCFLLI